MGPYGPPLKKISGYGPGLRDGIVTLFFIKFSWDDQKRHNIESGIEAEWHGIEI